MKRETLILSLIGSFAAIGVAQAETSVTLYGVVDTGYGYSQRTLNKSGIDYSSKSSGLHDSYLSGSRFGFQGVEDLGDGLRAVFVLESGINPSDGTTVTPRMFHRESNVGLSSDDWGTFMMGRQYNLADPFFGINSTSSMGDIDKTFGAASVRVDNMFRYTTPNFSGFQAGIGYAANGVIVRNDQDPDTNKDRDSYLSLGVQYTDQTIHAVATYDRAGTGKFEHAATSWALVGSYDFAVAKLALGYGQDRYAKINGVGAFGDRALFAQVFAKAGSPIADYDEFLMAHDFKASNYYVGLSVPFGGGTAGFAWARTASNLDDADKLGDFAGDQTIYSARYVYPLSKRTSVYVYGSYGTNIAYIDSLKATEAGLGLNHSF
ncbi:porin [Castellaniella sp.]|uniref:porin n=1 Tax=Castellaniella sp. TaxID=1955812 RepID=UPI002AFFF903|nr:porin [Castellaniella sp.]